MTAGRLVLRADAPREQWLEARRAGIGATDVVQIMGLSPYGNAVDCYLAKRLGEDEPTREAARWGQVLEDPVAREWAARRGVRVRRVGLMRHPLHPHHLASCDRRVVGRPELLEVKLRAAWSDDAWDDGLPDAIRVQAQWQLHVTGLETVHVAALVRGAELVERDVHYDPTLVDYLREEADRVWAAVVAGVPPDVPGWQLTATSLDRLHPARAGAVDVDPDRARPLIEDYRAARDLEARAAAAKELARVQLLELLGDAEEAVRGGRPAYSYRAGADQVTIPAARARALLTAHPDLAAEYAVTKPGRRTFALTPTPKAS
jgi:putative phage-type endonuclease